jgi:hypothetical protein
MASRTFEIGTPVERFNDAIRALMSDLAHRFPGDATIARVQNRVHTAMEILPLWCVENVGPYIYSFRNKISAGDHAFFIDYEFDGDIQSKVGEEKAALIRYIIPRVRQTFVTLPDEEKEQRVIVMQGLLDSFMEFVASRQK